MVNIDIQSIGDKMNLMHLIWFIFLGNNYFKPFKQTWVETKKKKSAKLLEIFLNCYGHNIHANQQTKCLSINKYNCMTKHGARI